MREYPMGFREVMQLPLRTFWSLNRYIDRLRAEEDLRSLQVAVAASTAGEGGKSIEFLTEHLQSEVGRPMVIQKSFDAAQFERLKEKIRQPGV
jgi:hypothetical protein